MTIRITLVSRRVKTGHIFFCTMQLFFLNIKIKILFIQISVQGECKHQLCLHSIQVEVVCFPCVFSIFMCFNTKVVLFAQSQCNVLLQSQTYVCNAKILLQRKRHDDLVVKCIFLSDTWSLKLSLSMTRSCDSSSHRETAVMKTILPTCILVWYLCAAWRVAWKPTSVSLRRAGSPALLWFGAGVRDSSGTRASCSISASWPANWTRRNRNSWRAVNIVRWTDDNPPMRRLVWEYLTKHRGKSE